jgi:hypothetical protein
MLAARSKEHSASTKMMMGTLISVSGVRVVFKGQEASDNENVGIFERIRKLWD